jgi:hypothetical protein
MEITRQRVTMTIPGGPGALSQTGSVTVPSRARSIGFYHRVGALCLRSSGPSVTFVAQSRQRCDHVAPGGRGYTSQQGNYGLHHVPGPPA